MPRPPIREPQNDEQRIESLERSVRILQRENGALEHEIRVLRDLMSRFLSADQIIEIVHEMETKRKKPGPVTER